MTSTEKISSEQLPQHSLPTAIPASNDQMRKSIILNRNLKPAQMKQPVDTYLRNIPIHNNQTLKIRHKDKPNSPNEIDFSQVLP